MIKRYVISLGGSLIHPEQLDVKFLKNFKALVVRQIKKGNSFVLVVGGGKLCRDYQRALKQVQTVGADELDWMGIYSTRLNAQLVRMMFAELAYKEVAIDTTKAVQYREPILIAAGTKPGQSTDGVAVKLAKLYHSDTVINASNIDHLFDKDPRKYKSAKKIEQISWKEYHKLVGRTRVPGGNYPFDPVAATFADKNKQQVYILNGHELKNLENALEGKRFKGTKIE